MYSYPHKTAYGPLKDINLKDYFSNLEGEGHSLYLHLPFCETKCGYCDLFSVTGCKKMDIDSYIEAVMRQMAQYVKFLPENTLFEDFIIGGGTPLLLTENQLLKVFEAVKHSMPLRENCKIIIETAPNQTTREKLQLLKDVGVTRVSMGIQSFQDTELKWLKRNHCKEQALAAAELLSDFHFDCVNLDFIYGIPEQTRGSLIASLKQAVSYAPDEIFLYPLYIKHGVKLIKSQQKELLNSAHTYSLYQYGAAFLKENGYEQISMRCFVKKAAANSNTDRKFNECGFLSTLSLGCGGRSYLGRLHTCAPYKITRSKALEQLSQFHQREDFMTVTNGIILSDEEQKRRYVIKHLFILPGISKEAYQKAFCSDVLLDFPILRDWIDFGWLVQKDGFVMLTEEGIGLSDYIGPQLISEAIKEKMQKWEMEND